MSTFDLRNERHHMHPLLATMMANNQAHEMRVAADTRRRGRIGKPQPRRITLRRPRWTTRIVHA
jgi:hypothetical protein